MLYYSIPRFIKENHDWDIEIRAGTVMLAVVLEVSLVCYSLDR